MKRAFQFQKEKFLRLGIKQQHKKCAEFLRHIVDGHLELLTHYNELMIWLHIAPCEPEKKRLLDRYHWHLEQSGTRLREENFCIETEDKAVGADYLPIQIYLDRLRSAHNIGSIVRTVEAFRLGHVVFAEAMAQMDHPQVQKSAMNAACWVDWSNTPLQSCQRPLIALETIPTATAYYDFSFPERFTLALGNEEYGCSEEVLQSAEFFIRIPLYGRKNSLNVAASFAILAAEIAKQKRKMK